MLADHLERMKRDGFTVVEGAIELVVGPDRHGARCADLGLELLQPADAILANLPYVPDGVAVAPEIARYEPAGALFAGVDGLDVIRRLVTLVGRLGVARPALLALELSPEQAAEVAALVADAGYATVQRLCDLAGSERVVAGRA